MARSPPKLSVIFDFDIEWGGEEALAMEQWQIGLCECFKLGHGLGKDKHEFKPF